MNIEDLIDVSNMNFVTIELREIEGNENISENHFIPTEWKIDIDNKFWFTSIESVEIMHIGSDFKVLLLTFDNLDESGEKNFLNLVKYLDKKGINYQYKEKLSPESWELQRILGLPISKKTGLNFIKSARKFSEEY